jgi:tRNA pseudouridine32 synthase/23S rRNA pseudouridine746 synthase
MRFHVALTVLLAFASGVTSFAPQRPRCISTTLCSTVEERPRVAEQKVEAAPEDSPLFGEEINIRLEDQMEKLKARDKKSRVLTKDELNVVHEDDHIVVVNKPSGVLSVPTREGNASLSQSVFEAFGCDMGRADMMVVHRLAMDSSGVMVLVRTMDGLRGMNEAFRTRQVLRKYEALVCGHLTKDAGVIELPIMRDYERPPFMRISTDEHQRKLIDLESNIVGKKILEAPKESITKYQVISREELDGQPVTRVALTSVSGR